MEITAEAVTDPYTPVHRLATLKVLAVIFSQRFFKKSTEFCPFYLKRRERQGR